MIVDKTSKGMTLYKAVSVARDCGWGLTRAVVASTPRHRCNIENVTNL